jgi:hypothetical protein
MTAFEAGIYPDMPEDFYHADPVPGGSLSVSGAKLLVPPSCPAAYAWRREHPKVSATFDYGTAAHKYVLGTGPEIAVVDAADWRTKAAREAREEAHAAGAVPLLAAELAEVQAMAGAIRAHPIAGALLDPARGKAEQSMFWRDEETGVWRRGRFDFLPYQQEVRRFVIADYKTTAAADRDSVAKSVANFSYHMQAAQYIDGARALDVDDDPAFLFVFQEKAAPYLIHVIGLGDADIEHGRDLNRLACEIWRDCTEAGYWPGYSDDDITYVELPRWARRPVEDF